MIYKRMILIMQDDGYTALHLAALNNHVEVRNSHISFFPSFHERMEERNSHFPFSVELSWSTTRVICQVEG